MPSNQDADPVAVCEATIPSGAEAPSAARTIISRWLEGRAHAELHEHARLLVSELVTNSVMHAEQPGGALLHIRAAAVNGVIRVEVQDHGHGQVQQRAPDPRRGGFGLYLLEQLAARWGVNNEHGTRVWFELSHHEPVAPEVKPAAARLIRAPGSVSATAAQNVAARGDLERNGNSPRPAP